MKPLAEMTDAELAAANKDLMARKAEMTNQQAAISAETQRRAAVAKTDAFTAKLKPAEREQLLKTLAAAPAKGSAP